MPDPRDPQLSISLDTAFGAALHHDATLREMMTRQFGPAGMLEVRRAMDQSDADSVLAAAARYRGTEAAAEACLWLGDRAVGGGEFNRARVWYRQAAQNGNAALAKRVAPRDRLAAAMLGQDVGKPVTEPVQFGEVNMPAGEFESLVADMRKTHAADGQSDQPARMPPRRSTSRSRPGSRPQRLRASATRTVRRRDGRQPRRIQQSHAEPRQFVSLAAPDHGLRPEQQPIRRRSTPSWIGPPGNWPPPPIRIDSTSAIASKSALMN